MLVVETEAGKLQRASARCCLQDGQIRVRTPLAQVVTPRAPVWAEEIDALSRCVRARTGWMVARRRMELATRGRACARASADGCTSADLLVLPMGARVVRFGVFRDDARQKQRASGWCHASSSSGRWGAARSISPGQIVFEKLLHYRAAVLTTALPCSCTYYCISLHSLMQLYR